MGQQLIGEDGRVPLPVQPGVTSGDGTTADRRVWTSSLYLLQVVGAGVRPGVTSGKGATADLRGWTSSPYLYSQV
jgi:hypothetical protein